MDHPATYPRPDPWDRLPELLEPELDLGLGLRPVPDLPARPRHATYTARQLQNQEVHVRMPEVVLFDLGLSVYAKVLYAQMIRWASWRPLLGVPAGTLEVVVGQLAADLGKSHAQTRRYLDELRAAGHITTTRARGGRLTVQLLWISSHPQPPRRTVDK